MSLPYVRTPAEISLAANYEGDIQDSDNPQDNMFGATNAIGRDSHGTHTSTTRSAISKHLDVEELEMLLEAYFVQIDGTLNKLSTVFHLHLLLHYCFLRYHLITWTSFDFMLMEVD